MDMDPLLNWFALKHIPGIGNLLFKRLFDRFKSPDLVFQASGEELRQIPGMRARCVDAILNYKRSDKISEEIERALKKGFSIVTMADVNYPPLLLQIPDPPPFLYVHGKLEPWVNNVAVVGSRNATDYGVEITHRLCGDLVSQGIVIVSGMAAGIDTAAHLGAIMGKGKTAAVMGSGFERIYPNENRALFDRIAENGAVITEFHLRAKPEPHHFPMRNRIISGMSLGTVVVEAARKSGSLITARLAAEQNREVFAVPGNIHSFKSSGSHSLIKQGAKLVEHAGDIIEEISNVMVDGDRSPRLNGAYGFKETSGLKKQADDNLIPELSSEESAVYESLGAYPAHIDELVRKISMEPGRLSCILLQLELKGVARQFPGKLFARGAS